MQNLPTPAQAAYPDPDRPDGLDSLSSRGYWLLAGLLALAGVGLVWLRAWLCDDAFITFHYVDNCLAGRGLVFNPGQRVQGFTHPLWCLVLVASGTVFDPHRAAIILGLLSTAAMMLALAWCLRREGGSWAVLLLVFVLLFSSPTFVEYQTSGLEGCLTHLLVLLLCVAVLFGRGGRRTLAAAALFAGLLVFNRPDQAALCAPILIWVVVRAWKTRCVGMVLLMLLPVAAWYGFATLYYGTPLPNTAYAKVAFPLPMAAAKGARYLLDYLVSEPAHALLIAGVITWGLAASVRRLFAGGERWVEFCLAFGILLHLVYIISIGGDFMRGRMILPCLVVAVALTARSLTRPAAARLANPALLITALLVFAEWHLRNAGGGVLAGVGSGIEAVRDQAFYTPVLTPLAVAAVVVFTFLVLKAGRITRPAGFVTFLMLVSAQCLLIAGVIGQYRPVWPVVPIVTAAAICAAMIPVCLIARRPLSRAWTTFICVLITASCAAAQLKPPNASVDPLTGITDEWAFYQNSRELWEFPSPDRYVNGNVREWVRVGRIARDYAGSFGPITLYYDTLGLVSHFAGPDVRIIDPHGLTDAFVARCAADPHSRVGHIWRRIPRGYLESCDAVTLLPGWKERLAALDPSLKSEAERMTPVAAWSDPAAQAECRRIQEVVTGPLFSWPRLRQIPPFVFNRGWGPPP